MTETELREWERLRHIRDRKLGRLLGEILMITIFLTLFFTRIVGVTCAAGNDMYPAVRDGDLLFYFRLGHWKTGDAVVYETEEGLRVGRIEGVSGTCIEAAADGQLTFDGVCRPADGQRGLYYRTTVREGDLPQYPLTPGEKQFFLLGDQREVAEDSRRFGLVEEPEIRGILFIVIRRRAI